MLTSLEFIGQKHILRQLRPIITGARTAGRPLLHTLLLGLSGMGKTYLANYICELYGLRPLKELYRTDGVNEISIGMLAKTWQECEIIFVDEIHRLSHRAQECLFRVMEERKAPQVDELTPGSGLEICGEIDIPPVTIIGATDQPALLLRAFKNRFGLVQTLRPYTIKEMGAIVRRRAREFELIVTTPAAKQLALSCRGTPRIVRHRIAAIRDYFGIKGQAEVTKPQIQKFLRRSGFDLRYGLAEEDRRYLHSLGGSGSGPLSLGTLSKIMTLEPEYLEAEVESYLIREGFVIITPSGRVLTEKGKQFVRDQPGEAHS